MKLLLERELYLHAEEELLVPKMSLKMWVIQKRRFIEWKKPLMQCKHQREEAHYRI